MCWVIVEPAEDNMLSMRINLAHAIAVEEYPEFFRLNYPGEGYYRVKKTPEMVEAYNSLVPVKSQPVVPAESDWVVQDKVPARVGIDQFRYVFKDGTPEKDWAPVVEEDNWDETGVYGYLALDGTTLELRCLKEVQP